MNSVITHMIRDTYIINISQLKYTSPPPLGENRNDRVRLKSDEIKTGPK